MTDVEAGYSLNFSYSNHRVSSAEESSSSGAGVKIEISRTNDRNTVYRDSGKDRIIGNSDDILTYYGFDYAGRTVNAYTTNAAGDILGLRTLPIQGMAVQSEPTIAHFGLLQSESLHNRNCVTSDSNLLLLMLHGQCPHRTTPVLFSLRLLHKRLHHGVPDNRRRCTSTLTLWFSQDWKRSRERSQGEP